jgi:hypothetical protein
MYVIVIYLGDLIMTMYYVIGYLRHLVVRSRTLTP